MRLYALRVQQRLIENKNYSLGDLFADLSLLELTLHKKDFDINFL